MSTPISNEVGRKRKKGGYKMPSKIAKGNILVDSSKKEWIILTSIAKGGFGEIYTAADVKSPSQQNFVIKIEPCENGPLFCEKTVYIRIGKKEDIKEYMKSKSLRSLGMPAFYGTGTQSINGNKFRFLVLERYGKDLWSIFMEQNRIFPPATVFKVANQVLDVLEYIHSKGYVHADIKGANLLLGRSKGNEDQVYLVDFGLAARYTDQYKPDPRRAHNGTLEYTSRDAHDGIVTRRGDIEILGYNLLQWLSSNLPWEGLKDLRDVQAKKIKFMKDIKLLMQSCFKSKSFPVAIVKYFEYLSKMEPLAEPEYNKLKKIMKEGITATGDSSAKLDFSMKKSPPKTKSKSPVPPKIRKVDGVRRTGRSPASKPDRTIDVTDSSEEDIIESTPEKKTSVKRSWKDCPSVVACAELLINDGSLRRSKRNK